MSWTALLWALDQEPETATDKMVLVALANFVSEKDGNYCYPGHEALAERARCSVDTARRSVARLQAGGFLRIKREKAKNGQHLLARYHLAFHVTTRAPDGRTKVHAANCGVDEFDPSPERPSHAENACDDTLDIMGTEGEDGHPADCGMDTKNHPANHPANCNHNHRNLKNLRTPPYPLEGEGERASDVPSGDAGNATKRRRAGERVPGWAAGWTPEAITAMAELRGAPATLPAVLLFEKLGGTRQPPAGVDVVAYVREVAALLADFDAQVVADLAAHLALTRSARLPGVADIRSEAVKIRGRNRIRRTGGVPERPQTAAVAAGDPELMRAWPEIRAMLVARLGPDVVTAWFDGLALLSLDAGGELTVAAGDSFRARWLRGHYDGDLKACAASVLGASGRSVAGCTFTAVSQRDGLIATEGL